MVIKTHDVVVRAAAHGQIHNIRNVRVNFGFQKLQIALGSMYLIAFQIFGKHDISQDRSSDTDQEHDGCCDQKQLSFY